VYELAKRSDLNSALWNDVADQSPDAWLWHRWEAIDAYATWERAKDISFALLEKGSGKIVALIPLIRHHRGWPVPYPQVRIESTGGPAFAANLGINQREKVEIDVVNNINILAKNEGAYQVDLSSSPLSPSNLNSCSIDSNPLTRLGFAETSTQSWLLQLHGKTKEQLWKGMEQRARKSVKRAVRSGVSTRPVVLEDQERFLRLLVDNTQRNRISAKPNIYYEQIFKNFLKQGLAKGYCAFTDTNSIHSIHIFGVYKATAIYWVVASDHYALSIGANNLVQWSAICDLRESGLLWYESGEAFPNESDGKLRRISDFKKSFGGTLVPYHRGTLKCRPIIATTYEYIQMLRNRARLLK